MLYLVQNTVRPRHLLREVSIMNSLPVLGAQSNYSIAAWDFHAQHKDKLNWDLAVLNPPFVCLCFRLMGTSFFTYAVTVRLQVFGVRSPFS
jgi:hypothetical protein